jgi:O-antigen/teichoic acid export membrane protein
MSVDKLFVGEFWGESQLGVYYLAQSFAMSLLFIDASVRYVFIPGFVSDIKNGRLDIIGTQARRMARYIYTGFIPLIVFVWLFGEAYFEALFGSQFKEASIVLAIQLIGIMASLLSDPLVSVVVAVGKSKAVLTAAILALSSSVVMLVLLVPESIAGITLAGLGIRGAAIAFATAFIVQLVYYRMTATTITKYLAIRHFAVTLAVPCAAALTLTLIPNDVINIPSMAWTLLLSVLFVLVTALGLYVTRVFTRDDLRFLMRAISIKENARYIRDEIGAEPPGAERIE